MHRNTTSCRHVPPSLKNLDERLWSFSSMHCKDLRFKPTAFCCTLWTLLDSLQTFKSIVQCIMNLRNILTIFYWYWLFTCFRLKSLLITPTVTSPVLSTEFNHVYSKSCILTVNKQLLHCRTCLKENLRASM